jgi:hypothetical protein
MMKSKFIVLDKNLRESQIDLKFPRGYSILAKNNTSNLCLLQ